MSKRRATAPSTARFSESALNAKVIAQATQLQRQHESIEDLKLQIEDRGWRRIGNDYNASGLDLASIKAVSEDLRAQVAAGGMMKRIDGLLGSYIYGDGFGFKGLDPASRKFLEHEDNIAKLFSIPGIQEVNRAHGTDGNVVFLVAKKKSDEQALIRLPFDEVGDPYIDSDDPERVWYIRRTYTRKTTANPTGEQYDSFIPTNRLPASQKSKTSVEIDGGISIPVEKRYTAILWKVNGQTGWTFGIPNYFASLQWVEKYTGYLKNQDRFAEALSMLAWQYKATTADQAKKMRATVSAKTQAGTAVGTDGMDVKPLPGSSDVSFDNGEPMAAQAAAAAGVPTDALLSKSSATTSGKLEPDFVRTVVSHRAGATAFFKALGRLIGSPKLEVIWPDLENESPFRDAQMIVAAWSTGLFEADELRPSIAEKLRIDLKDGSTAPKDVYPPTSDRALEQAANAAPEPEPDGDLLNGQGKDKLKVGKTSDGDNAARDAGEV